MCEMSLEHLVYQIARVLSDTRKGSVLDSGADWFSLVKIAHFELSVEITAVDLDVSSMFKSVIKQSFENKQLVTLGKC